MWSNLGLLFWLSLFPFVIRWVDERGVTSWPVAAFGFVLTMASISYLVLEKALIAAEGDSSGVAAAVGGRAKEWISFTLYVAGSAGRLPRVAVAVDRALHGRGGACGWFPIGDSSTA